MDKTQLQVECESVISEFVVAGCLRLIQISSHEPPFVVQLVHSQIVLSTH